MGIRLPYDFASKEERDAFRLQNDVLNSMCDAYSDLRHELLSECDAIVAHSLLEQHVNQLSLMLETRSKRCLLGFDLLSDCYESVERGEDLLSESIYYRSLLSESIPKRASEGPVLDNAAIEVSNPLLFRNDMQTDDLLDEEEPVKRTATAVPTSTKPCAPDPGNVCSPNPTFSEPGMTNAMHSPILAYLGPSSAQPSLAQPGPALGGPESANAIHSPNPAYLGPSSAQPSLAQPGPVLSGPESASALPPPNSVYLGLSPAQLVSAQPGPVLGGPESAAAVVSGHRVTFNVASTLVNTAPSAASVPASIPALVPTFGTPQITAPVAAPQPESTVNVPVVSAGGEYSRACNEVHDAEHSASNTFQGPSHGAGPSQLYHSATSVPAPAVSTQFNPTSLAYPILSHASENAAASLGFLSASQVPMEAAQAARVSPSPFKNSRHEQGQSDKENRQKHHKQVFPIVDTGNLVRSGSSDLACLPSAVLVQYPNNLISPRMSVIVQNNTPNLFVAARSKVERRQKRREQQYPYPTKPQPKKFSGDRYIETVSHRSGLLSSTENVDFKCEGYFRHEVTGEFETSRNAAEAALEAAEAASENAAAAALENEF